MNYFTLLQTMNSGIEPVPLSTIVFGLITLGIILSGIWKLYYDRRIAQSDLALAAANATRQEQQRLEKLVIAPLVTVASEVDKATQILYFGHDANDITPVLTAFQEYGVSNRIITKVTIESIMEYLSDHQGTTLCIVAYMSNADAGNALLTALKGNRLTMSIPIVAIDGFSDSERVRLFEAGIDGFLTHPFMISALMLILTRLGFSSGFSKNK